MDHNDGKMNMTEHQTVVNLLLDLKSKMVDVERQLLDLDRRVDNIYTYLNEWTISTHTWLASAQAV